LAVFRTILHLIGYINTFDKNITPFRVFYQVFLFFYTRKGGGQVRRRKGEGRRKDGKAKLVIPNPRLTGEESGPGPNAKPDPSSLSGIRDDSKDLKA
jgi:hypothetical protein